MMGRTTDRTFCPFLQSPGQKPCPAIVQELFHVQPGPFLLFIGTLLFPESSLAL